MNGAKNIKYKYIKNKKEKKFYLSIIVMTVMFAAVLKMLTMTVSTSAVPTLFINDLPFEYCEKYPLEMVEGFVCVPLMYIAEMPGVIDLSRGDALCLLYQKSNYISFGNKDGLAVDMESNRRGIEFYCPVYTIHNVKYVRAETVCNSLGLTWNYEKYNGISLWRIKDRTARKSFEDLITRYVKEPPTLPQIEPTPEPTTQPPTTQPPVYIPQQTTAPPEQESTAEPTTAENTRGIENYFMFSGIGRSYDEHGGVSQIEPETEIEVEAEPETEYEEQTENGDENAVQAETEHPESENEPDYTNASGVYEEPIGKDNINMEYFLDILKRDNITAVFFFTESEILRNPTNLRQAYAMGHEVGIEIEGGKINPSPEDLIAELEKVNALIYTVTKNKTRFYMFDENIFENYGGDNASGTFEERKLSCIETLAALGYCRIRETLGMADSEEARYIYELYAGGGTEQAVNEMTEFLKQEELNIIRFDFDVSDSGAANAENMNENCLDLVIKAVNSKFYISARKATVPFFASVNFGGAQVTRE